MTPDIFVEFGPRSILSLIGIITIIGGVWYTDRTWDEKGQKPMNEPRLNQKVPEK